MDIQEDSSWISMNTLCWNVLERVCFVEVRLLGGERAIEKKLFFIILGIRISKGNLPAGILLPI